MVHRGVVQPGDLDKQADDDQYVGTDRTHLQGHRAHSNVGHQEQQIRQAETHQEFVEHRKHYLEKQWMVKENND